MTNPLERFIHLFNSDKEPMPKCWGCGREFIARNENQRYCKKSCKPRVAWSEKPTKPKRINYYAYLQSEDWRRKADAAKKRSGYRCQVCNRDRSEVLQLEAHHRTYEFLGDERPADLTVLCNECHDLFSKHGRLAKPPKR